MKLTRRGFCAGSTAVAALLAVPNAAFAAATCSSVTRREGVGEVWGLPFWSADAGELLPGPCSRKSSVPVDSADPFAFCH
jgi:hypothetical protein